MNVSDFFLLKKIKNEHNFYKVCRINFNLIFFCLVLILLYNTWVKYTVNLLNKTIFLRILNKNNILNEVSYQTQ